VGEPSLLDQLARSGTAAGRRIGALAYFGMIALYGVVIQLADPLGGP
jgi:hypothetical protein